MLYGDLHASTSAHHDVYTGGNLLRIMKYFQARTSTYGFPLSGILLGATFKRGHPRMASLSAPFSSC
jgi:hypothetical protein